MLDQDLVLHLDFIQRLQETYHLKPIFIHIDPPETFILNKLRNYTGDRWLTNDQEKMVENYFSRKELHVDIENKIQFDYVIDTSLNSLQSEIERMAKDIIATSPTSV